MLESIQVKVPTFVDNKVNIRDFGAVSDGKTLNTEAINAAVEACAAAGGGQVIIPKGLWLTGPIILKSGINLHVEAGAVVLFTPNYEQYPLRKVSLNGVEHVMVTSPIYGEDLENIAITGSGVFDGSGHCWRPVKRFKMTDKQWRELTASGGVVDSDGEIWWPNVEAMEGAEKLRQLMAKKAPLTEYDAVRVYLRPRLMNLINCRVVLIDGPTFQNSPMWNLHPILCEDITLRNITVRNPWYSQNGDGLDLESCRNAVVENSVFDVGDDAICLKSGKDEIGRKIGVPTENVVIRDCRVYHGHGGFVIGSEMSGGVRNIWVTGCQFIGTDVGLRFKSTRGRGGVVENVWIDSIDMVNIDGPAILFDMYYEVKPDEKKVMPVTEETPKFRNVSMKNVICRGADIGIFVRGLPEMPVRNLTFENVSITSDQGIQTIYAEAVEFKQVLVEDPNGKVLFDSEA